MFDLYLLPLLRREGQEQTRPPGLYMVTPPRRTARGRVTDRLILHFSTTGTASLPDNELEPTLAHLAQLYYKTPGAVTSVLRVIAEELNQTLLDLNLQSSSSGKQCIGLFSMAVLREDRLTLAQCGPVHAFLITPQETQHYSDLQVAGRGLGLARAITLRYYQIDLHENDLLLLSPQPPDAWVANNLQGGQNLGMESMRRRLLSLPDPDIDAILIQAQAGSGKLRLLLHKQAPVPTPVAAQEIPSAGVPETVVETPIKQETSQEETPATSQDTETPDVKSEEINRPQEASQITEITSAIPAPSSFTGVQQTTPTVKTASQPLIAQTERMTIPKTEAKTGRLSVPTPIHNALAWLRQAIINVLKAVWGGITAIFKAILPDASILNIPAGTMIFIAVAVAVIFATAGGVVYRQRGRIAQYNHYIQLALTEAEKARKQSDPIEVRTGWEATLYYLDKADTYQETSESSTLRSEAMKALDKLDAIERLDFQPAIVGGLDESIHIVRMVVDNTDLYMLNAKGGNILRATLTGQGYEKDPNFICGPNKQVGAVIDITLLPRGNSQHATILGVDKMGNIILCTPDDRPTTTTLAPPQTNWGSIQAIRLESNNLYVLDPQTNGVWIYRDMEWMNQPHLFFGEDIPNMTDVIDLAINQDDLYLLHKDGYLSICIYSGIKEIPTRCTDPANYTDRRAGRQNGPLIHDAKFSQIIYSPPPDPSIYMLDPVYQAIYHFSMKLTLRNHYRMLNPLPDESATAFAVSPNHTVLMAISNHVYYAPLP